MANDPKQPKPEREDYKPVDYDYGTGERIAPLPPRKKTGHEMVRAIAEQEQPYIELQAPFLTRREIADLRQPNGKPLPAKVRNEILAVQKAERREAKVAAILARDARKLAKQRACTELATERQNELAAEQLFKQRTKDAWENSKTFQLWHKAERAAHPGSPS